MGALRSLITTHGNLCPPNSRPVSAPTVLAASPQNVLDGTLLNSMAVRANGGAASRGPAEDHDNCDTASASNAAHAHVDVKLEPIGPLSPTLMAVHA